MNTKAPLYLLMAIFLFWACGGAEETATSEEPEVMEEEMMEDEEPENLEMTTIHSVTFTTPDYDAWREQYRAATNDENLLGIFVNMNEPGRYMIAERNDGHENARGRFESEAFDSMIALTNTEVIDIDYLNTKYGGNGEGIPYRLGIIHEVDDYDVWEEKFWEDKERRNMAGIACIAITTKDGNPNMVYIWMGVNDVDVAMEMISTEDTKRIMDEAGVVGEPVAEWWQPVNELN